MASVRENARKGSESTWSVLFRHGKRQSSRTFETEDEAEKAKALIELIGVVKALRVIDGDPVESGAGLTVDQLFEEWFAWKRDSEKVIQGRTLKDYRRDYENWIQRDFGTLPADSITELQVQQWADKIAMQLDGKTVADRHMLFGQMYRWGNMRSRQRVSVNPFLETSLPGRSKKAPKGFKLEQWDAMHRWGAEHEPDADDLNLFFVSTGWRWQESTPLKVKGVEDYGDVEVALPDGRRVWVPRIWVSVDEVLRRTEDGYEEAEGEAKSRAGVRRINLPMAAALMVRRRIVGKDPDDYVFTTPTGNRWHAPNFLERNFQRILDGAKIKKVKGMGPHYFRHTHVLMLDRAGVSLPGMQRRLGHEDVQTTIGVYGGMIDNSLGDAELVALNGLIDPTTQPAALTQGQVVAGELV